jgi:hypothetical protein
MYGWCNAYPSISQSGAAVPRGRGRWQYRVSIGWVLWFNAGKWDSRTRGKPMFVRSRPRGEIVGQHRPP